MEDLLPRTFFLRSNPILPMIRSAEIPTRIPHHGRIQLLQSLNHIFSESILVRKWIAWVVDAAVDASSHVSIFLRVSTDFNLEACEI